MDYPQRAKDGLKFQIKDFVKKFYQMWSEQEKKYVKSDTWLQGFSPRYIFDTTDGKQVDLSREQFMQALIAAFDEKKHWKECQFVVKTNGKEGKDIRYFVNIAKDVGRDEITEFPL